MKGRKPKPGAVKRLHGNTGRRGQGATANPRRGAAPGAKPANTARDGGGATLSVALAAPMTLNKRAREIWDALETDLRAAGLLEKTDRLALAKICGLEAMAEVASAAIDEAGLIIEDDKSRLHRHPAQQVYRDCVAQLTRLYSEFGLTACARARLSPNQKAPEESPIEELLRYTG